MINKTNDIKPPKWAQQILQYLLKEDLIEEVLGDLEEKYIAQTNTVSKRKADLNYWYQTVNYLRPFAMRNDLLLQLNPLFMWRHNLKITVRKFRRHKASFLINLIGLSTGLACVLLIWLWVSDELNVDKFNEIDDRLYQVMQNAELSRGIETRKYTPLLLADALEENFPQVETALSVSQKEESPSGFLSYGENRILSDGYFVPPDFFKTFSYGIIEGKKSRIFKDKKSIVISENLALKLFNSTFNLIGKTLKYENPWWNDEMEITGVFKNPPANATEQFDFIMSIEHLWENEHAVEWGGDYATTFVVLKEGTDVRAFNLQIAKFMNTKTDKKQAFSLFIQRFSKRYLHGNYVNGQIAGGRIAYVRLFSLIAILILLMACINFTNLSTAQAATKMKEIGVKKVIGAQRHELIIQFLSEATLMVLISTMVAIGIVAVLLPQFNDITHKSLNLSLEVHKITMLGIVVLVTGLIAGGYSAFYLSGFQPIAVLKANLRKTWTGDGYRKVLVVCQFTLSAIFIVCVIVINQQMNYIQTRNLGYNRDNVMTFRQPDFQENSNSLLTNLKNIPGVQNCGSMYLDMLHGQMHQKGYSWKGEDADRNFLFKSPIISYDVIETLGMQLLEGRTFSRQFQNEEGRTIINESALKMMGIPDPVGKKIKYGHLGAEIEIIGVVSDFNYGSIHEKIEPLIFRFREVANNVIVKLESGKEQSTIAHIEQAFKEFHPDHPFIFGWMDADYQALYESESRVAILSKYFSGLAIVISCLGLFGLAMFTAERRKKEIGIRKILGSSGFGIVRMLSSDFIKTVVLALIIAVPISYAVAISWLSNFEYRIAIKWWYFTLPAILILLIALFTISMHTIKAARMDPINTLKAE